MSDLIVACWVPGVARTKGSLNPANMQDTPASKAWRAHVARCVAAGWIEKNPVLRFVAMPELVGAFQVRCAFYTAQAPEHPLSGDLDKLVRNVLDAIGCTRGDDAHLIADDRMVTQVMAIKAPMGEQGPGLDLEVRRA